MASCPGVSIRSIHKGASTSASAGIDIGDDADRALVLRLLQFPTVVEAVAEHLEPHRLCTCLYEPAASFHQFYERRAEERQPD